MIFLPCFLQEHKCVLDSCRVLEGEGFEVTYLPVLPSGLIDLNKLQEAIRPTTVLVSVMGVNNEIGVKQPLAEIGISIGTSYIFCSLFVFICVIRN